MTDSFVTQCPHCHTSFRVSSSQLEAARGAVRCGACLHVFNAHQHLLDKPKASAATSTIATPQVSVASAAPDRAPAARKDPLDTVWIHDDLDLDSLDLDEELARLEQEEQSQSRVIKPLEPIASALENPDPEPVADERWAEQLLEESQRADTDEEITDTLASATAEESEADVMIAEQDRQEPVVGPIDEDPGQEHLQEALEPVANAEEIELTAVDAVEHPAPTTRRHENLFELNDDPLQLQWQAPRRPWGRWIGWGLLNVLAAGALASQYVLYHFDELARQERYRPWFEMACPHLGCNLPSKVDVGLIRSSNLVVRSHPDFAGALVVDAIIYNRASFEQPFPLLELRFSDINNQLLANRRFKPSEYLAGELSGQTEMPPQTPVHISLDILDPGQEAVNYSLTFQSPE